MSGATVTALFEARAALQPEAVAIEADGTTLTYRALRERVLRTAAALVRADARRTGRVAILSENRPEYLEAVLATARLGVVLACQNWRLTPGELQHCLDLVDPGVLLVSPGMAARLDGISLKATVAIPFGPGWEAMLAASAQASSAAEDPEAPWLVLYTGGTTGLPKGAVLSQRAEVARAPAMAHDLGLTQGSPNLAWPPMYHMGGTDPALATLMGGGRVIVHDGFDPDRIARALARTRFGWVSVMPGAAAALADALERAAPVLGVGAFGVMPDLVPPADIARLTLLMRAPWCNTFGSTETGTPPLSAGRIVPGESEPDFGKLPSPGAAFCLLDETDGVGEAAVRGPTLFSGYWNDLADHRSTWFRMGDLFRRRADGKFDFVERSKYLIKSGGENIYPAEIERVLLLHPDVAEALVVRRRDARWGEVPVALVATRGAALDRAGLEALCRARLAGYKQPRTILRVDAARLARGPTGKLPRTELEAWVERQHHEESTV